jgi:lipopolysaccharide assembly protein A
LNNYLGEATMRWVYLLIIVVFALATLIFAVQNLDTVTVSFLSMRVAAPLALLVLIIYVLGAVTGSSLLALLRRSYRGSRV